MVFLKRKYKGFLWVEMVVSLTVLSILLVGLAVSLGGFRRFNRYQLIRQRCTAAVAAQSSSTRVRPLFFVLVLKPIFSFHQTTFS